MTYRELQQSLKRIPEYHLDDDVTVFLLNAEEYVPIFDSIKESDWVNDILDEGHPYLTIDR